MGDVTLPAFAKRTKLSLIAFARDEGLKLPSEVTMESLKDEIEDAVVAALEARESASGDDEAERDGIMDKEPMAQTEDEVPETESAPTDPVDTLVGWDSPGESTGTTGFVREVAQRPQEAVEQRSAVPVPEKVQRYRVGALKRYAGAVLGVPSQALAGAQSAGLLPLDDEVVTIDEARAAVEAYMEMEVRSS